MSGEQRPKAVAVLVMAVVLVLLAILGVFCVCEELDAAHIMVVQSPVDGKLTWHNTPGPKWQGGGKVTVYNKRNQFWFSNKKDQGKPDDESIKIRFNDGGHAMMSGSVAWEMPTDEKKLTDLHAKYGTGDVIEQQLVRTIVEKSIYMTGPLMSSAESYASRRNDLLNLIEDQINYGIYRTDARDEMVKDPITGVEKTVRVVKLIPSTDPADKGYKRQEVSPLEAFGIRAFNLSLNSIEYAPEVEAQIQHQQQSIMAIQTAMAKSKQAEQDAITAEMNGKALAASAKWAQEVVNIKEVTEAEKTQKVAILRAKADNDVLEANVKTQLLVAETNTKIAEQKMKENTLLGEGEAARRKLVMEADGALEKKLEAYVTVNKMYAEAIAKHQGNWVPQIVMGGNPQVGQAGGGGATDLINLLTMKVAKDLSLDPGISLMKPK